MDIVFSMTLLFSMIFSVFKKKHVTFTAPSQGRHSKELSYIIAYGEKSFALLFSNFSQLQTRKNSYIAL